MLKTYVKTLNYTLKIYYSKIYLLKVLKEKADVITDVNHQCCIFQNRSSSAVNTVYMFAERKSPEEYKCAQDTKTVLSQLIAHVHSAKKLLKPLNRVGNVQKSTKKGNHSRSRSFGESIKVRTR